MWRRCDHRFIRPPMTDSEYHLLKQRVYKRDKWKCRCPGCKAREGLHAHHIVFRSHGGPDTAENLITICNRCHDAVHAHNLNIVIMPSVDNPLITYGWEFLNGWSPTRRIL